MKEIDARGLSCPEPVLLLKNALNKTPLALTVDNKASADICARFAASKNFTVETVKTGACYTLTITPRE